MRPFAWVPLALLFVRDARAGTDLQNVLVGPVLGIRLDGDPASLLVVGVEGGVGVGPERVNLGFEHRDGSSAFYLVLNPWYVIGGSLGVALETDRTVHPVLGIWEGLPINGWNECTGIHPQATLSIGYRFTGIHVLYTTVKAGAMDGFVCRH